MFSVGVEGSAWEAMDYKYKELHKAVKCNAKRCERAASAFLRNKVLQSKTLFKGSGPTVDVFAIATYGCLGANAYDLLEPWNEQTKKYGPEVENIPVGLRTRNLESND